MWIGKYTWKRGHTRGPLVSPTLSSTQGNLVFKAPTSPPNCITFPQLCFQRKQSHLLDFTTDRICHVFTRGKKNLFCRDVSTCKKPNSDSPIDFSYHHFERLKLRSPIYSLSVSVSLCVALSFLASPAHAALHTYTPALETVPVKAEVPQEMDDIGTPWEQVETESWIPFWKSRGFGGYSSGRDRCINVKAVEMKQSLIWQTFVSSEPMMELI